MIDLKDEVSTTQLEYVKKIKRNNTIVNVSQIVLLIIFLLLWEICGYLSVIDPFIFSTPSRVGTALIDMLQSGEIFLHVGVTLFETLVSFILATVLGMIIAIGLWGNKLLYRMFEPYLIILNSLPKTALAPILIVWIGNNMKSIIVISILLTIIVTIVDLINSFNEIEAEKIKLIYSLGGKKSDVLKKLILPSSISTIISVLKINIGLALTGVIIGEILVAKDGLGYLIIYGSQIFKMDWVMLSLIILAVLAGILYKVVTFVENKLIRWKE